MSDTTDWFSAVAALVSAAGGAFAARAAFLSARSARDTQNAADEAERRVSLREVSVLASSVTAESQRITNLAQNLKIGYQTMGAFSGSTGNSGIEQCIALVGQKVAEAAKIAEDASLFGDGAKSLSKCSLEDVDRVHTRQAAAYNRVHALREELEREQSSVEARNATSRESRDRTRLAR